MKHLEWSTIPYICSLILLCMGIYNTVEFHYFGILEDKVNAIACVFFAYVLANKKEN